MNFNNETYFHINFDDPFTRVPNTILDNENLSYSAIGVVTQMLRFQRSGSHKVYAKSLISYRKDSKTKVSNALKELIQEGFVIRTQIRDEKGQMKGYRYDIFDTPQNVNSESVETTESQPCAVFPTPVKPEAGKTEVGETGSRQNRGREIGNIKENSIKKKIGLKENDVITTVIAEQSEKNKTVYIKKYYESYIGVITPNNFLQLLTYLDDGMEADVIIRAVDEAVGSGVKNYKYVKTILNNWIEAGVKTVLELTEYQNEFERKKKSKQEKKQSNSKTVNTHNVNKNKFANFNQTFTQYEEKELDEIIKKSQKEKFK
ncbi:TPA: DnaD domain protein [Clostridioides difficile]|nr:DnaD domain protein [Clostridioides difficile]HBF4793633.1 DnaD domain protein [Clostridioides difficile]HBF5022759.1 DnaD domain protein [Clostridioides difficile]HBF5057813.1 DnaD domain protein [Clostridioides difficile]HBF5220234.1 DnaD domain protein [Clostridioides difficile]